MKKPPLQQDYDNAPSNPLFHGLPLWTPSLSTVVKSNTLSVSPGLPLVKSLLTEGWESLNLTNRWGAEAHQSPATA